ncbi:MAG: hypothetical protein L0I24_12090, partial [Pseudonocardia sp.]|nr:hypothetical protein [Pseudonocardia sp.]
MTAPSVTATGAGATGTSDATRAEEAWARGDAVAAIDAADRALADGSDRGARAAGFAGGAAAADGALADAAARWRDIAGVLDAEPDAQGAAGAWATARAALLSVLAGDVTAGAADLAHARD